MLKSGDLIIHNLTEKDEGTYRCFANISKSFFYGEVYNLSLSANETSKPIKKICKHNYVSTFVHNL